MGILAARYIASKLKAVISLRGAGRFDGINRVLEAHCAITRARRQLLHRLRVVVAIAAIAIGVIADPVSLLSCKLNDGNLVLLACVLNALVLLGNGVDKVVGSILERIDTLGRISTTHRIIH